METMTETGTEKRVDELSKRVDFGFEQLSDRVDFGFDQVNRRLDESGKSIASGSATRTSGSSASRASSANCVPRRTEDSRGSTPTSNRLRTDTKAGFDSLHQLMIRVCAGTIGSIIAGVVVLLLSHS